MIVDVHTRIWDAPEQLGPEGARYVHRRSTEPWAPIDASSTAHEAAMRAVDASFVLGYQSRLLEGEISNEAVAGWVEQAPSRRVGFAGIDPLDDGWRERYDQAIDLGLAGVVLSPAAQGLHPTHSEAMRLYERCEADGKPVIIDQLIEWSARSIMSFAEPWLLDEVARSFPNLAIMMTRLGHPWVPHTLSLLGKHENLYADVAAVATRPWELYNALLAARQMGVLDKLLLGSSFPFATPETVITEIFSTNAMPHGTHLPGIKREPLRALVERDAFACLGIPRPEGLRTHEEGASASRFPVERVPTDHAGSQERI